MPPDLTPSQLDALDAVIAKSLGWSFEEYKDCAPSEFKYWFSPGSNRTGMEPQHDSVPAFSRDISAAMELVETSAWEWSLYCVKPGAEWCVKAKAHTGEIRIWRPTLPLAISLVYAQAKGLEIPNAEG